MRMWVFVSLLFPWISISINNFYFPSSADGEAAARKRKFTQRVTSIMWKDKNDEEERSYEKVEKVPSVPSVDVYCPYTSGKARKNPQSYNKITDAVVSAHVFWCFRFSTFFKIHTWTQTSINTLKTREHMIASQPIPAAAAAFATAQQQQH